MVLARPIHRRLSISPRRWRDGGKLSFTPGVRLAWKCRCRLSAAAGRLTVRRGDKTVAGDASPVLQVFNRCSPPRPGDIERPPAAGQPAAGAVVTVSLVATAEAARRWYQRICWWGRTRVPRRLPRRGQIRPQQQVQMKTAVIGGRKVWGCAATQTEATAEVHACSR